MASFPLLFSTVFFFLGPYPHKISLKKGLFGRGGAVGGKVWRIMKTEGEE